MTRFAGFMHNVRISDKLEWSYTPADGEVIEACIEGHGGQVTVTLNGKQAHVPHQVVEALLVMLAKSSAAWPKVNEAIVKAVAAHAEVSAPPDHETVNPSRC